MAIRRLVIKNDLGFDCSLQTISLFEKSNFDMTFI